MITQTLTEKPSEPNTGSTAYQIAALSARILRLTAHMQANRGDQACLRGMLKLIGRRRRLQRYLVANPNS